MKITEEAGLTAAKPRFAYEIPDSIGKRAVSKDVLKASDSQLAPIRTMVEHSMEILIDEGIPSFPGYGLLSGLSQNGIIRAGVEMRAKEMTRKWGKLERTGESIDNRIESLERTLKRYKIKSLFREAAEKCGFLGGCLLYIDTGEPLEALVNPIVYDAKTFPKGELKGFKIVDPFTVYPGVYNTLNPLADDYFKPKLWYIQGVPVHCSRFIKFSENELPTMIRPAYNFFGMSLAQRVLDAVSHFTRDREAASKMLEKVSLTVLKTDMSDVLSGGGVADMNRRIRYFAQNRDTDGVAVIDYEREDLAILNNTLSGITDIVRQSMEYVAAMFNEPATKLWGISPAGMNATGESDMKNHYDNIASLQEQMYSEPINKVIGIIQLNEYGNIDPTIEFKFSPLSEESEESKAAVNKAKADTYAVLNAIGAIAPEDVRDALIKDTLSGFNDLEPYERIDNAGTEYAGFNVGNPLPEENASVSGRNVSGLANPVTAESIPENGQ